MKTKRCIIRKLVCLTALLTMLIALPVQAAPNNVISYEAIFDSTYYAEHNPDLQAVFGNDSNALLSHFIQYGMAEGRQGNAEFNVRYYKNSYSDLQAAFGENLAGYYMHYMLCGKTEGRVGNGEIPGNTSGRNHSGRSNSGGSNSSSINSGSSNSGSSNSGGSNSETVNTAPESVGTNGSEYAYEVIDLVNQVRAENGLGSVSATSQLMDAAQVRATETATLFSHTRPDGSLYVTAFNGVSYRATGENIATGQRTPQSVMASWLNSTGHRNNILNPEFKHIGVGCYQTNGGYGIYWTQCFTD